MYITTIELPIYKTEIVVIINSWEEANKKFKLDLSEEDFKACSWTIHNEDNKDKEIFLLLRDPLLDYNTICHELFHVMSYICVETGIVMEPINDEPLAYLQGYVGGKVFEFVDKYTVKSLEARKE